MDDLKTWIGKKQVTTDRLTAEMVKRFNVTVHDNEECNPLLLNGLHYCLGNEALPRAQLGEDSHPAKGGFMPPIDLPRRMWAGSKIRYHAPLPVGQDISKTSTIADIVCKHGKTGDLVFVTVDHEYVSADSLLISEAQTIVYREAVPYKQADAEAVPDHAFVNSVMPDVTQLFRYSAITFNGHRIHYDQDYVREVERYPDLVVHGPLIATWLMNLAQEMGPEARLTDFEFRGISPAFVGGRLSLLVRDKNCTALEARNERGALIMTARAEFEG